MTSGPKRPEFNPKHSLEENRDAWVSYATDLEADRDRWKEEYTLAFNKVCELSAEIEHKWELECSQLKAQLAKIDAERGGWMNDALHESDNVEALTNENDQLKKQLSDFERRHQEVVEQDCSSMEYYKDTIANLRRAINECEFDGGCRASKISQALKE